MKVRKGFTLVELLIVLAIIGVLMSIGIPIYTNQLEKAKARVIASNLRTIAQTFANVKMLGDSVSGNAKSSITELVKGIRDVDKYDVYIEDAGNGKSNIYVAYNDDDVSKSLVTSEVGNSCDYNSVTVEGDWSTITTYNDGSGASPACVLMGIPELEF